MILTKKVRLYPTKEQEQKLWQSVGTARFIYNYTLAKQEENHRNGGKFIPDGIIRKELTQLKKTELTWLKEVSNNVTKQAVKDACNSYKRFFKGLANKPKFKSKKKSKPSFYNDPIKLKIKDKKALIEKVGWIKINEQIPSDIKYSNPRITYDNKYWYISVGIEVNKKQENLTDISLGIDLGLKDLAICSDGKVFKNINKTIKVRKLEKRLKQKQRQISRKYEMNKIKKEGGVRCQFIKTKNIEKLENTTKLIHRKLANIRNNYLHQVTTSIVKTKPYRIVIEDLNVSGMMKNKHLSDSVRKQCFYKFRQYLTYKTELYGIKLVVVDRFYPSSKTCSQCGSIKKDLKLKDRVYRCPHCGAVIDRDYNAALNLSMYKLA
ncbi:RNA-guided endonuclease InsQ/TnpB family protein [Fusobacterium hominis]|uniref:IS200/IS605 family element transposase accessory protein TnpB n=1 Tax=Fusobacterium hominis TaxID=2764326 RepID=A0A7G9GUT2_9FUSO|nr:RNA-guided endonuclease TnpB family protein [Fusobacterium hominis]QNM14564.1 IS200/IS605 family element transposase accessory protein TnpB [Fusobacterium hominis]